MQSPHPCPESVCVKKLGTGAPLPIAAPVTGVVAMRTIPRTTRAAKGRTPVPNFFMKVCSDLEVPKGEDIYPHILRLDLESPTRAPHPQEHKIG